MTRRPVTTQAREDRRFLRRTVAAASAAALAAGVLGISVPVAHAAEVPAPTAHYDMSRSGDRLLDVSGNERHAPLTGASADSFVELGGEDILRFRGDLYATLPSGPVTGADNDFTVEFTVTTQSARNQFGWVIGAGVGPWNTTALGNHVFLNPMSGESAYNRQVLSGIRVKSGPSNGEVRLPAGGGLNQGFTTMTLVGSGDRITVYRDGVRISTVTHPYSMSSIVPSGAVLGYLGRSLYSGDALLTADVADVKFWDAALTADQVSASMPSAEQKSAATEALLRIDILDQVLGDNPSLDRVTSDLNLPASINGVGLTWTSSNPAVISATGVVSRDLDTDTAVTVAATTSRGTTVEFEAIVRIRNAAADLDAISLTERTTENLPLIASGDVDGSPISWVSSDPALVTSTDPSYAAPEVGAADPFAGGGIVTRPPYGAGDREVTLTASAMVNGMPQERVFTVTVAEQARSAPDAGYAAAYFRSDSDERIYQAATSGNDFFTFSPVNGGNPVIASTADTTGLRDPYILRSNNGDKYYMIATDLCIGCGTGWGPAQSEGSLKVAIWESTDLVDWTRTNGENAAITVNQPAAGMTWAPEAYWDDDLQSYVLFFSSRLYSDASKSNSDNLYARVFYVLTRDFQTFTYPPETWQDTGFARIDSTITKIGDYYYRFTKNEENGAADGLEAGKDIFLERSKVLTAPTVRSDWDADPETTWQLTDTQMTRLETQQVGEGPQVLPLNQGDPNNTADGDGYVFLVDNYGSGGYRAFLTDEDGIASSTRSDRLSQRAEWEVRPRGGLPASPRHGSFVSVTQGVLDALNNWAEVAATSSTTTATVTGRSVTAEVAAADGGQVAGTVTFSGGNWSESVALIDQRAEVEVPAGVQAVVARYDGYRDNLVSPSQSDEVQVGTIELTASATTRCVAGTVQQIVTVRNADASPVTVTVSGEYGSRTLQVAAGRSASMVFATRQSVIAAETMQLRAVSDQRELTLAVPAAPARCT